MTIKEYRIHPAIGIARVGDSEDQYFIGPERAGRPEPPPRGYKDDNGRIKRQAARFRVFGYDEHGNVVREITHEDAEIRWSVHLVNRKAAARRFVAEDPDTGETVGPRNEKVKGESRSSLVIDPGERRIAGRDVHGRSEHRFDTGTFNGVEVDLGELRTDEDGRLVVLGGYGRSGAPGDEPLTHFADNDGWFDDTSDGPVRATLVLHSSEKELPVVPAWVIVAPPDFAPSIGNLVTLHDIAEQVAMQREWLSPPDEVSFERDILPVLDRAAGYQWVDAAAFRGHRRGDRGEAPGAGAEAVERHGDFHDEKLLNLLGNPADEDGAKARRRVFGRVRAPRTPPERADAESQAREEEQATAHFMPQLSGDGGTRSEGKPATWLTVTALQYRRLELWAHGRFRVDAADDGSDEAPLPGGDRSDDRRPAAVLDRAALENCVGGGMHPGIEAGARLKEEDLYVGPYRLDDAKLQPGGLTERMAVPWQADFALCGSFWWPAQRPSDVITEEDYESVLKASSPGGRRGPWYDSLAFPRHRWDRGIGPTARQRSMVDNWSRLGFVVPRKAPDSAEVWIETERDPYLGLRDRDYFHIMLNPDEHPGFRPTALALARRFLAEARAAVDRDELLDSELAFFAYDERAFRTRLDSIYRYLVDQVAEYDPAHDVNFPSREAVVERIRQFAPLNQTDGAWLRNIEKITPQTEVTKLLAHIWNDETGNGRMDDNHAYIYTQLMQSLGLDLPPVESLEYALDPKLVDSAFTVPLLQYVVSEFTEELLPEILGMTLHFEWESVWLKTQIALFEHHGIDARFYRLHLAIDNVAEGHGVLATRAVRRYLADYEGDELQRLWRRIWDGYVAFREAGTLFEDLLAIVMPKPDERDPADRVKEMIVRKRPYGSLNHGRVKGMRNDLFDDPDHMLKALQAERWVIPGRPNQSRLVEAFEVNGAMYQVFTEEEQQLWRDWIISLAAPAAPSRAAAPDAGGGAPRHYKRLLLSSPAGAFRADPRQRLRGRGAVQ